MRLAIDDSLIGEIAIQNWWKILSYISKMEISTSSHGEYDILLSVTNMNLQVATRDDIA